MRKISENKKTKRMAGVLTKTIAGTTAGVMTLAAVLAAVPVNVLADEVIMEWREENGVKYWYENGVRQGVKYNADGSIDISYRGKEIYDPSTEAWYWLDCVQNGAVAKNKDVYQESAAGQWGAGTDENGEKVGKWVRYDANGHMVKGWQTTEAGTYYFDPVYGTMAKGLVEIEKNIFYFEPTEGKIVKGLTSIDGNIYYFDLESGIAVKNVSMTIDGNEYKFDSYGRATKKEKLLRKIIRYESGEFKNMTTCKYEYNDNNEISRRVDEYSNNSGRIEREYENGNIVKKMTYGSDGKCKEEIDYNNANMIKKISYESDGNIRGLTEYEYDGDSKLINEKSYYNGQVYERSDYTLISYEYNESGRLVKKSIYDHFNDDIDENEPDAWYIYEYDELGNLSKESTNVNNLKGIYTEVQTQYTYDYYSDGNIKTEYNIAWYHVGTIVEGRIEYEYDNGKLVKKEEYQDGFYGVVRGYKYEYDEDGYMTKATRYGVSFDDSASVYIYN